MNFIFHSVRWRLQLWHALILLGVIVALCLLAYRLAAEDRRDRIDRELVAFERAFMRSFWSLPSQKKKDGTVSTSEVRQRFQSLVDAKEFPLEMRDLFDPQATDRTYIAFWDGNQQLLYRSANAPESLVCPKLPLPDQDKVLRLNGVFRELVQGGPRGFRSVVGRDTSVDRAALVQLGWQISASGALLWLLGLLGGWWLAGRVIQPIAAISQTASRIAQGKLSERIDVADADNELSRLSEVLNETFDRLAWAIERQREFTADASHELRTPLTVILSETSRGLKRERTTEEYREVISNCSLAAIRMRALVESLLILARQDGDSPSSHREDIDVSMVVKDTVKMLQPLADQKRIQICAELQVVHCHADPGLIGIVAGNLISNAVLHQPAGGQAIIRVFCEEQRVILEVSDCGPGIAAEHLPRLFDRFYRVDPARGPASGNSGLGLAIVKAVVKNQHGTVEVQSEIGQGTTFRVSLPRLADY